MGTPPAQRPPSPVSRALRHQRFVRRGRPSTRSSNERAERGARSRCFRHGVELEGVLQALGVGVQSAGTDRVIVVEGDPQAHTLGDFDERDADGSGDDDDGSIFSFDDDESGDGSDAESRSDFDEEDEEDEGRRAAGVLRRDRRPTTSTSTRRQIRLCALFFFFLLK